MVRPRKRRDHKLLDAIEAIEPIAYDGPVWRVVRSGRDPTRCSRSGGRWDDGSFDVLYTSETSAGAVAELRFHLLRGQPVFPSLVAYNLYEIAVSMKRTLKLFDLETLARIGIDTARYGQLSYQEKAAEYPRSQDVGEVARFLDYDGLIVPSAREACMNVVVFCDRVPPEALEVAADRGPVDWG